MERIDIVDNVSLVYDKYTSVAYLFIDVKNLKYIEIEAQSGYESEAEMYITEDKQLDRESSNYYDLKILECLGVITREESDERYKKDIERRENEKRIREEESDKTEYERLKEKFK